MLWRNQLQSQNLFLMIKLLCKKAAKSNNRIVNEFCMMKKNCDSDFQFCKSKFPLILQMDQTEMKSSYESSAANQHLFQSKLKLFS